MPNRTEATYNLIFYSKKRILTQQKICEMNINTIKTDMELALINRFKTILEIQKE